MKRKCRYTDEQIALHDEAVKLRKMTDKQLVEAFRAAQKSASSPQTCPDDETKKNAHEVKLLLRGLAEGRCKGVKGATAYKVACFARELGLIE